MSTIVLDGQALRERMQAFLDVMNAASLQYGVRFEATYYEPHLVPIREGQAARYGGPGKYHLVGRPTQTGCWEIEWLDVLEGA